MNETEPRARMPRRAFLKRAVAGAAAASTTVASTASGDDPAERQVDVALIGAGLAGLTAARELRRHDLRVCVLESGAAGIGGPWAIETETAGQQVERWDRRGPGGANCRSG